MKTPARKIKSRREMIEIVRKARETGKKVGFTNGCFDILHAGHVRYLAAAKRRCDMLVVGVNSDSSVRRLKGKSRPLNPEKARLEVLAALESVDYVTLFSEDTPLALIKSLTPDMLFKGGDWKEEDIVGAEHVKDSGGAVKVIPYVKGYSTTATLARIAKKK